MRTERIEGVVLAVFLLAMGGLGGCPGGGTSGPGVDAEVGGGVDGVEATADEEARDLETVEVEVTQGVECESTKDCSDLEVGECQKAVCRAEDHKCVPVPDLTRNGQPCTSDDKCAASAVCQEGQCAVKKEKECPESSEQCKENRCNPSTGECEAVAVQDGTGCGDVIDVCHKAGQCKEGECDMNQAGEVNCDDGNECTKDYCDVEKGGCQHEPQPGQDCEDGNLCTVGDKCNDKGECVGGDSRNCDDQNDCTKDDCKPEIGCVYDKVEEGTACDDGNACTKEDQCKDGICEGTPIKCDDGNECTIDHCDPKSGCIVTGDVEDGTACDDWDPCTEGDQCQGGKCKGQAKSCDDGNVCTKDYCDGGECKQDGQAMDGTACNDGDPCTEGDQCQGGKCEGQAKDCDDGDACTVEQCNSTSGECEYLGEAAGQSGYGCVGEQLGGCTFGFCQDGTCAEIGGGLMGVLLLDWDLKAVEVPGGLVWEGDGEQVDVDKGVKGVFRLPGRYVPAGAMVLELESASCEGLSVWVDGEKYNGRCHDGVYRVLFEESEAKQLEVKVESKTNWLEALRLYHVGRYGCQDLPGRAVLKEGSSFEDISVAAQRDRALVVYRSGGSVYGLVVGSGSDVAASTLATGFSIPIYPRTSVLPLEDGRFVVAFGVSGDLVKVALVDGEGNKQGEATMDDAFGPMLARAEDGKVYVAYTKKVQTGGSQEWQVRAAQVQMDGQLTIGPDEKTLAPEMSGDERSPWLWIGSDGAAVVYVRDYQGMQRIYFTTLESDLGAVVDSGAVTTENDVTYSHLQMVRDGQGRYYVVWQEGDAEVWFSSFENLPNPEGAIKLNQGSELWSGPSLRLDGGVPTLVASKKPQGGSETLVYGLLGPEGMTSQSTLDSDITSGALGPGSGIASVLVYTKMGVGLKGVLVSPGCAGPVVRCEGGKAEVCVRGYDTYQTLVDAPWCSQ